MKRLAVTSSLLLALLAGNAPAQVPPPPMEKMAPARVLNAVGVDQKIGDNIDLDLVFKNEAGEDVKLRDYFGKRPVILSLVYYECPGLCTMVLNGLTRSLNPLSFDIGKEFDVLTVSFDPRETPELARKKKEVYVRAYGRPGAAEGWHFLTGSQESITALTQQVGFRYEWDEASNQFAHSAAIILITPQGKISRYFYGLEYPSNDIRLGVIESTSEKVGTLADQIVLLCYQYDPHSSTYSLRIMRILQVGAVLTMLSIGGFAFVMLRRERRSRANNV
jgi:protein SCO1/2